MTGRYIKCQECGQSFTSRYVKHHVCGNISKEIEITNLDQLDKEVCNDMHNNVTGDSESEIDNYIDPEVDENEDNCENEDENNTVTDDVFYELFREASFLDDDIDTDENLNNDSGTLVNWLCLFLAYWQYTFNITDSALEFLLKFLSVFFQVLEQRDNPLVTKLSHLCPATLYSFHKFLSIKKSFYTKYVVCYKCNYLYDPEECIVNYRGEKESAKCSFVKYPNHRMKHHRKKCGNLLMKTITSPSGEKLLL